MSELNQEEVNEQMYLFVKRWLDDLPFEESKKVPVMAIAYCLARLSKQDELLKEQEAVKRTYRTGINGFSIIWTCGACGSDLYPNNAKAKYCSNCGRKVKWE